MRGFLLPWIPRQDLSHRIRVDPADQPGVDIIDLKEVVHGRGTGTPQLFSGQVVMPHDHRHPWSNGQNVIDLVEPNGTKRSIVLWQNGDAVLFLNNKRYVGTHSSSGDRVAVTVGRGNFQFIAP